MARKKGLYSVYKGDEMIALGTAKECAEQLGIKDKSVICYASDSHKRKFLKYKNSKSQTIAYRIGDIEDEVSDM
jgi:hypothetical protein